MRSTQMVWNARLVKWQHIRQNTKPFPVYERSDGNTWPRWTRWAVRLGGIAGRECLYFRKQLMTSCVRSWGQDREMWPGKQCHLEGPSPAEWADPVCPVARTSRWKSVFSCTLQSHPCLYPSSVSNQRLAWWQVLLRAALEQFWWREPEEISNMLEIE